MPDRPESQNAPDTTVLADPGSFTVEQVAEVLSRSDPDQIAAAKEVEAQGKARRGILEFQDPRDVAEPAFRTDERFGLTGWRERARWFTVDGRQVSEHALAGALAGADASETFTQAQVQSRVERFLKREAT